MNKILKPVRKYENILLLLISAVIICVPILVIGVSYEKTYDDYLMNYIVEGGYGGYNINLLFPCIAYGALLRGLYLIIPNFNWYCTLFMVFLTVSYAIMLKIAVYQKSAVGFFSVIVAGCLIPYYLNFTVIAYALIGSGAAWGFLLTMRNEKRKWLYAVSAGFMIMGYMIRPATMMSTIALFVPVVVMLVQKMKLSKNEWIKLAVGAALIGGCLLYSIKDNTRDFALWIRIVFIAVVIAGYILASKQGEYKELLFILAFVTVSIIVINTVNCMYRYSPEWREFTEYTRLRASVIDYDCVDYNAVAERLANTDFTARELTMIKNWTYIDKEVFSKDALIMLRSLFVENTQREAVYLSFPNLIIVLTPFVCASFVLLIQNKNGLEIRLGMVLTEILFGVLIARERFVARVSISLCIIYILVLILLFDKESVIKGVRRIKGIRISTDLVRRVAALMLAFVYMGAFAIFARRGFYARKALLNDINNYSEVAEYMESHKDNIFLFRNFTDIYSSRTSAIAINKNSLPGNVFQIGGWDAFSPRYYKRMRELGINDPDRALLELVNNDSVRLVDNDSSRWSVVDEYDEMHMAEIVREYLEVQTGKEIEVVTEKMFDNGCGVFDYNYKEE